MPVYAWPASYGGEGRWAVRYDDLNGEPVFVPVDGDYAAAKVASDKYNASLNIERATPRKEKP